MNIKIFSVLVFLILLPAILFAQDLSIDEIRHAEYEMKAKYWKHLQERIKSDLILDQSDFDVKYWELDIDVTDLSNQVIYGKVTMTSEAAVDGLVEIDYDLHNDLEVDSIFMNGAQVSYSHSSHALTISLDDFYNSGDLFTTIVYYHGHPPGSGFGSFTWNTTPWGNPMIATLSEPEGAREWWPCKDMPHDKADSADIVVTVPDYLVVTSNGALVSDIDNGDGTRMFQWHVSYPITTYLISLAISNYQSFTDWYMPIEGDPMPIVNYVYPEHYNDAVEDLGITPQVIEFLAEVFGEYPFVDEKYGHSIFTWGGAMEHQCNTSYGAILIRGDHAYDWILVHELAHQWFGDLITCDIWPEIWMNEGFASYLEALWIEGLYGFESYIQYMQNANGVSDPSGPIYDPDPLFGHNTVYNKGSWVLHMLRGVMGDDVFFEGMYAYANHPDYMYGTITTREFQAVMEQYYGNDLGWFFDQWVWGMNRPEYLYSWMKEAGDLDEYEIFLHIEQTQQEPAPLVFTMPIRMYPNINGEDTLITIFNDSREGDYRFTIIGNPMSLGFDIEDWILKYASQESYGMNIVTAELPDGVINVFYSELVEARGGQPPYQFNVVAGNLPSGLNLDENSGSITGIPDAEGESAFTIRCSDSSDPYLFDTQDFSITVVCDYVTGDANGSREYNGLDVTYGVNFFKGGPPPPFDCECTPGNTWYISGDVNGSCDYNGLDVTYGVAYFKGGPDPFPCPDCPSAGLMPSAPPQDGER